MRLRVGEVLGFTADADTYCANCAEKEYGPDSENRLDCGRNFVAPIFAHDEWDTPVHCADCGGFLGVKLTPAGRDYVLEIVVDSITTGHFSDALADWIDCYRIVLVDVLEYARCDVRDKAMTATSEHNREGLRGAK